MGKEEEEEGEISGFFPPSHLGSCIIFSSCSSP